MEIIGLGVLLIVAACIWQAWGPKVLLAVIVVPPVLIFGAIVAHQQYRDAQYTAKQDAMMAAKAAHRERCDVLLRQKALDTKGLIDMSKTDCNPFDLY